MGFFLLVKPNANGGDTALCCLRRLIHNTKDHAPVFLLGSSPQNQIRFLAHTVSHRLCTWVFFPVPVCIVLWGKGIGKDQCGWPCTVTFLEDKSDVTTISSENFKLRSLHQPSLKWVYFNDNSPCLSSSYRTFLLHSSTPGQEFLGVSPVVKGIPKVSLLSFLWLPGLGLFFTTALSQGAFHSPAGSQALHWYPGPLRMYPL